jgi:hypothetical protein
MDVFRVLAGDQAALVALEVFEAAEGDGAEGFDRCQLGVEGGRPGLERPVGQAGEEGIAALGLARHGGAQVEGVLQFAGQAEDVGDVAADQLQLDLADRRLAAFGLDAAAVDPQFDHGFAERHMPDGAPEVGGEHRLHAWRRVVEEGLELGIVDMAEVEFARAGRRFPLVTHGEAAAGWLGGLDGEQPVPALLAKAHGHEALVQVEVRGVVIGIEQVLALRLDAGEQRMRRQLPCGLRGHLKLELDFRRHE